MNDKIKLAEAMREIECLRARNDVLEVAILTLDCYVDWCGKSPRGTPGKRGYDDGKCSACRAIDVAQEDKI